MGRQSVPPRTDVPAKVPGALEQLQAGMVFQAGGDGAGMVDAVVVADHHEPSLPLRPAHLGC
jgi:hypothetical protein